RWFRHPVGWCNGGRDDAPRGCLARRGLIERAYLSKTSDRIRQNVVSVRGRIAAAAHRSGRAEASLKLLQLLDTLAREVSNPPAVCLQVNTSGEESKHGWSAAEILADSDAIAA